MASRFHVSPSRGLQLLSQPDFLNDCRLATGGKRCHTRSPGLGRQGCTIRCLWQKTAEGHFEFHLETPHPRHRAEFSQLSVCRCEVLCDSEACVPPQPSGIGVCGHGLC